MTPEATEIVLECRELMLEVPEHEPAGWLTWRASEWQDQREHGPRYLAGHWFGGMPESRRMRYRRAIDALEAAGLLVTWRNGGLRLSHIKLTPEGLALAEQLSPLPELEKTCPPQLYVNCPHS